MGVEETPNQLCCDALKKNGERCNLPAKSRGRCKRHSKCVAWAKTSGRVCGRPLSQEGGNFCFVHRKKYTELTSLNGMHVLIPEVLAEALVREALRLRPSKKDGPGQIYA